MGEIETKNGKHGVPLQLVGLVPAVEDIGLGEDLVDDVRGDDGVAEAEHAVAGGDGVEGGGTGGEADERAVKGHGKVVV